MLVVMIDKLHIRQLKRQLLSSSYNHSTLTTLSKEVINALQSCSKELSCS